MEKNKKILIGLFIPIAIIFFFASCSMNKLLPSEDRISISEWKSYQDAEIAFNKIKPYETTLEELKELNFDPQKSQNVVIFDPITTRNLLLGNNPSIKLEDLPLGAQDCIKNLDECKGFRFRYESIHTKGEGNIFLRTLRFNKKDLIKGWQFEATIFLKKDVVIYTLWQGSPNIDQVSVQKNPLGPLTDIFGSAPSQAISKF